VTVIATGFESGGAYRPERVASAFSSSLDDESTPERGAKIPPFLVNRQGRLDGEG
jgi:cell division protein FtsZ